MSQFRSAPALLTPLRSPGPGDWMKPAHKCPPVRNRCVERAEYGHLMFIDLHSALIEVWRGDFTDAAHTAKDAIERAEQLGGDHALVIADAIGAVVAAYAGREQEARTHARAAIEQASRCGSPRLADQAIMSLGFLEVSLGNNADALTTLEPLVARFGTLPGTEIVTAAFLPDANEAMIALGSPRRRRADDRSDWSITADGLTEPGCWPSAPVVGA